MICNSTWDFARCRMLQSLRREMVHNKRCRRENSPWNIAIVRVLQRLLVALQNSTHFPFAKLFYLWFMYCDAIEQ